jgi:hypothetical protein
MVAMILRFVSGAFAPLFDQATDAGARLLWKLALFAAAAAALAIAGIAATLAFGLWIASMRGPVAGALAVAALYAAVAILAVVLALWPRRAATARAAQDPVRESQTKTNDEIDAFTAPLLDALSRFGLRREQLAVLAGASLAKQLGPLPLVGLAILAGFLVGRLWHGLFSQEAIASLLGSDFIASFFKRREPEDADEPEVAREEAA